MILLPQRRFRLLVLMREIALESRAEIDMPAPEPADEGLGILVVMRAEFAVFAGVFVHGGGVFSKCRKSQREAQESVARCQEKLNGACPKSPESLYLYFTQQHRYDERF